MFLVKIGNFGITTKFKQYIIEKTKPRTVSFKGKENVNRLVRSSRTTKVHISHSVHAHLTVYP